MYNYGIKRVKKEGGMNISFEKPVQDRLIVKAEGKLGIETGSEFENEVKNHLQGIRELVIDCAEISYISSFGLRIILSLHKYTAENNCSMYIKNASGYVKNVFDISGFNGFLNIV